MSDPMWEGPERHHVDGVSHASPNVEKMQPGDTARDTAKTVADANTPISLVYLTFDTDLPSPALHRVPNLARSRAVPDCPNLRRYESPLRWGPGRKAVLLVLSCVATFLTAYSAGAYSPPSQLIADDLQTTRLVTLVGITTFCLGFAVTPMALAPISEISGRYPIFVMSGLVYVIFEAACAVMPNIVGMLICRFLVGAGGSVFSAVVGGVISDVWEKEKRNTPMAIFSGCVLGGTGAGPLVSAILINSIASRTWAWKWIFWHQVIVDAVLVVALIIFFKESRGSVILSRKARRLNKWYRDLEEAGCYGVWAPQFDCPAMRHLNVSVSSSTLPSQDIKQIYVLSPTSSSPLQIRRIRWIVEADEQRPTLAKMISTSVRRPFYMLFTEPVVFCFSLWAAFSWAVLYLSFSVVPLLYGTDLNMSSRVYIAMMVASVVATAVGIWQEKLLRHSQWRSQRPGDPPYRQSKFWQMMRRKFPADAPEARLYFACLTAMMLPAGLFGAFMSPSYMDGYSRAVGLGFATWGIYSVYLATFNYLADSYNIYASSALAAQSAFRNLLGGSFPLVTGPLFINLGVKGAGGVLGAIAAILTVTPWVLVFYGGRIRAKSKFAKVSQ